MSNQSISILNLSITAAPTVEFDSHIQQGLEVRAGNKITLRAAFTGVPKPNITWVHHTEHDTDITESKEHVVRVSLCLEYCGWLIS